jgi:hypothetical protein
MEVSWAGLKEAPRINYRSITIPFTSPVGATEPSKTGTAIDINTMIPKSVECRVDASSSSDKPRRSARIAAKQRS